MQYNSETSPQEPETLLDEQYHIILGFYPQTA